MICNIYVEWWNGSVSKWWQAIFHWCSRLKLFHASLYSVSYSHLAGVASGTPDSVKDVVEGDDVVLQCRFSPALADSSATLYWIRWHTHPCHSYVSVQTQVWWFLKNSWRPSLNLSILRNINDQHDNVAIGETPFSTGYTWVTNPQSHHCPHKQLSSIVTNRHISSSMKRQLQNLMGLYINLQWNPMILVAFKLVACPSIAFGFSPLSLLMAHWPSSEASSRHFLTPTELPTKREVGHWASGFGKSAGN